MVNFTDKKLYLKGTCQVNVTDPCDGRVLFSSDKFQTANINTSVSPGEIRAGMGNGIATMIPSDSAVNVEFNAADFNLWAKSAQVGATLSYGAPSYTCVTVEAEADGSVQIDPANGVPVAGLGFPAPFAYVQEVGVAGTRATTGTPYSITADGLVNYTGESGKEYKVTYFSQRAEAQIAVINSMFDSKVVHFTAQMPVFRNDTCSSHEGSRVGWFYVVVPRMKLGGNGGIVGDQTTPDTTSLSGQAVAYDDYDITSCGGCGNSVLAYYSYVPDNGAESVVGIAIVGGYLEVGEGATVQAPVRMVMENGELVPPSSYETGFTYTAVNPPSGTTVSDSGLITAGDTEGDFELLITYDNQGKILTTSAVVSVKAVRVIGIYINGGSIVVEEGTTEQIVTEIEMSDGSIITPTDFQTGFTYSAPGAPAGTTISSSGLITAGPNAGTFIVTVAYTSGGQTFTDTVEVVIEEEPVVVLPYSATLGMRIASTPSTLTIPYRSANLNHGSPTVSWGDGTTETITSLSGTLTHTFTQSGEYDVIFRGGKVAGAVGGYYCVPDYVRMSLRSLVVYVESDQPGSVMTKSALASMSNLKTAKFGPVVTGLGELLFSLDSNLESVESYAESLEMRHGNFNGCRGLKTITFKCKTLTCTANGSGYFQLFNQNNSLEVWDISNLTSVPALPTSDWDYGMPTTTQIKVPAALLNDFKTATNWSKRASQFVGV